MSLMPYVYLSETIYLHLSYRKSGTYLLLKLLINCSYAIMRDCWRPIPEQRPSFTVMRDRLEAILNDLNDNPESIIHVSRMTENMQEILGNLPGEKC